MSEMPNRTRDVVSRPVAYEFSCLPDDHPGRHYFTLRVERRGPDSWAVVRPSGFILFQDGAWDYEVQPSSRTASWLAGCRFTYGEAVVRAEEWAAKLAVNGHTVEDALTEEGWHA